MFDYCGLNEMNERKSKGHFVHNDCSSSDDHESAILEALSERHISEIVFESRRLG